jgi:hypothetical protein
MSQCDDILAPLRAKLPELRRRYPIASLGLFGSFARNEARADSDLDILVEFDGPISLSQFLALGEEVVALTGRKVDFVSRRALKPYIGDRVMRELVTV